MRVTSAAALRPASSYMRFSTRCTEDTWRSYRVLKPGGLFTSTEYSTGPGGDIIYPVTWA